MGNSSYFTNLLTNIELSKTTKSYVSSLQSNLRDYLKNHIGYKTKHIDTFLSGSYAKNTSIRSSLNEENQDVDIVVLTNYTRDTPPVQVLNELKSVLKNNSKYKEVKLQSKSIGIEMANYHIDVVPIVKEADHFYIGNHEKDEWNLTDPKKHIYWSTEINTKNEGKYKPIVKIFKWWRKRKVVGDLKLPKGILLEKIIADNFGESKYDIENLLVMTMENIVDNYKTVYIDKKVVPSVYDPVLPKNNLFDKYSFADFSKFIELLQQDLLFLRENHCTVEAWEKILGNSGGKSIEDVREEYSFSLKRQMDELLNQVIEKSKQLSVEIKDYENKKKEIENREKSMQKKEDEIKYDVYLDFLQEAKYNLSDELIKGMGREYWMDMIKILESIKKKKNSSFRGYEYSYFASLYKALELKEEYYNSICLMVEDGFYLSNYDVKYIIDNTYFRKRLIDILRAKIIKGDYSDTVESYRIALKLLEENYFQKSENN